MTAPELISAPATEGRGMIQRICGEPGEIPHVEYLHREDVLFTDEEWQFRREAEGVYLFPTSQMALDFAEELSMRGMKCFPVVVAAMRAVERRREDAASNAEASCWDAVANERRERHQRMLQRNRLD